MHAALYLIHPAMIIHALDIQRVLSVLSILTNRQVEIRDLKIDQKGRIMKKDLKILRFLKCVLDIALSIAASVIVSLLLLSGDIEQNPGPGKEHCCIHIYSEPFTMICHSVGTDLDYASVDATQILSKPPYDVKTWLYVNINASSPQCVGEDDLTDVLEAVVPIQSAYYALGRSLRLRTADLRSILEVYPNESDAEQALYDILELWLQQKYNVERFGPPTWRMLVEAVDRKAGGNNHELAKKIASDHSAAGE